MASSKLSALQQQVQIRDLIDIRALIEAGVELDAALRDCPGQDAGFSPLTFAWGAQSLPIRQVAKTQGWTAGECERLEQFRDELVARVVAASQPEP